MRTINGYFIDKLADWFEEHTQSRPRGISVERSHRGRDFSNIIIKMPESFRAKTHRKQLTLPVEDAMIDGIMNGVFPDGILNIVLGGAIRKAGLFDRWQEMPELDKYLY